jgi:murein DD-endopeptidase MepM/ murein hydrolase activator NlpD
VISSEALNQTVRSTRAALLPSLIWLLCLTAGLGAQNFPELTRMDNTDPIFLQISDDIQAFYRWQAGAGAPPSLSIYQYRVREGDSLFSLAARLNVPQASLATLNRLDHPDLPDPGSVILVPNIPGMFVPEDPVSDFEKLLSSRIDEDGSFELSESFRLPSADGGSSAWRFIIAGDFTSLERRAFLQILFRDPLPTGYISSRYGMRASPITGEPQFHFGLDLVAPEGTPVRATAEGVVEDIGFDPIYGNFVSIAHPGGYRSLYAHLKDIFVAEGDDVVAGQQIASVGSSGLSTGSHLHFEILYLGRNRDPQAYIRRES